MKTLLLGAAPICALACAACHSEQTRDKIGNIVAEQEAGASSQSATKAFLVEEKNDLYEFDYAWSAEAAAVLELVERFHADMAKVKTELVAGAEADKANRDKEGEGFNPYSSSTAYETSGQSIRLLSLFVEIGAYTGGAHGNYGASGLLWDRTAKREIEFANLFAEPANMDRLLTQRWCDALNLARQEKLSAGYGVSEQCPPLSDLAVVPTDKDGDGRFERLILTAGPYVAGSYAEGTYEVDLAVTPDLITALKADYRASFEAQPQ